MGEHGDENPPDEQQQRDHETEAAAWFGDYWKSPEAEAAFWAKWDRDHEPPNLIEAARHQLREAVETSTATADILAELAYTARVVDDLTRYVVHELRRKGTTWNALGEHLGVSRQAAQQRYSKPLIS